MKAKAINIGGVTHGGPVGPTTSSLAAPDMWCWEVVHCFSLGHLERVEQEPDPFLSPNSSVLTSLMLHWC